MSRKAAIHPLRLLQLAASGGLPSLKRSCYLLRGRDVKAIGGVYAISIRALFRVAPERELKPLPERGSGILIT